MPLTAILNVTRSAFTLCAPRYWRPALLSAFLTAASLSGGVTFTDSTFKLTDYTLTEWVPDPNVQITVQQNQSGGNPSGPALELLYSLPANSSFTNTMVALVRTSFSYDPAKQGALQSIDFSVDKYLTHTATSCGYCYAFLDTSTAHPLILQNGSFYAATISVPSTGSYVTGSAKGLAAKDFALFDFNTGIVNPAVNPNFSSGVMQFGLGDSYFYQFTQPVQADVRYANLTFNLTAVTNANCPIGPPTIASVTSASDFGGMTTFAPGSYLEVKGTNLTVDSTPRQWATADFQGSNAPIALDGSSVSIDGHAAFVSYISSGQINVQAPADATVGPVAITVTTCAGTSAAMSLQQAPAAPGVLAPASFKVGGKQYLVATFSDGTYVGNTGLIAGAAFRPAHPGETVIAYGIGFGPVAPAIAPGVVVSQANGIPNLTVSFDTTPASISYAGLAGGFIGLYEFYIIVPNVSDGDYPINISVGPTQVQQTAYLTVHQ